jgi:flagellar protein FliO/FliZ
VLAASSAKEGESTPLDLGGSSSGSHTSAGGASLVRTIVGLAIVIAVIWGLAWILRKVKEGRDPHVSSAGLVSVAALNLSSGRSVHLVRAGSEYVLLGSAEHGVVPIHRYTEEQARDAGLLPVEAPPSRRPRALLLRANAPAAPPALEAGEERPDPMRMPAPGLGVIERLRELTVRR